MDTMNSDAPSSIWKLQGRRLQEAEADGRELLRHQPLNAHALSVVARAHCDRGDDVEAIRLFKQAIHADPGFYESYDALVRLYRRLGWRDQASTLYDEWAYHLSNAGPPDTEACADPHAVVRAGSAVDSIAKYYALRAPEYDVTCNYMDQCNATAIQARKLQYQQALAGRNVIEVACGTGYWTEVIAATARSVLATDRNAEQISIVQARFASTPNVRCRIADAYTLDGVDEQFDGAFSHFWWSHIPKSKIRLFLSTLHSRLKPDAVVIFSDSLPYLDLPRRLDEEGNLLEQRSLLKGESYEIIKNFPVESEIRHALAGMADHICYDQDVDHGLWTVTYRAKSTP